jgi:hypothetical protein
MDRRIVGLVGVLLAAGLVLMLIMLPDNEERAQPAGSLPGAEQLPATFLNEPMTLHVAEYPAEVLAVWRRYAEVHPTLLLLSSDAMLTEVPESLRPEVAGLIASAPVETLARRSAPHGPDPLLLPVMTVDAALRAGWLGELALALPLRDVDQELSAEALGERLLEKGAASAAEVESLQVDDHRLRGAVRGVPLVAAILPTLPPLAGPVIIHIDLSYFQQLYKNEVATPLIPLVLATLTTLRELRLETLAVTFSYGNREQRVALDVRFVGEILGRLIERPEMIDQPLPVNWRRQGEILALANFFQKDRIREIALAMDRDAPGSAWVKFDLYRSAAEHHEGSSALGYLAEAVALDGNYALEYSTLAGMAYEKGRPDEALRMLKLAAESFPDNPQLRLEMAQLAAELGDGESAQHLVEQLRELPWSPVFFAGMPAYLDGFAEALKSRETAGNSREGSTSD